MEVLLYVFIEEVFYMLWILFAKCDPDICINFIWIYILTIVDYVIIWAMKHIYSNTLATIQNILTTI